MIRIDLRPYIVDRYSKRSVSIVVNGGEEDYMWIWGRKWGREGHFNDDNPF